MNTTTQNAPAFTLTEPTSGDARRLLGITDDRADEIIEILKTGAKADGYSENIKGAMWGAATNLPTEGERLLAAFLIGHGVGNNDQPHFGDEDGENPLASLMEGLESSDDEDDNIGEGADFDPLADDAN